MSDRPHSLQYLVPLIMADDEVRFEPQRRCVIGPTRRLRHSILSGSHI